MGNNGLSDSCLVDGLLWLFRIIDNRQQWLTTICLLTVDHNGGYLMVIGGW